MLKRYAIFAMEYDNFLKLKIFISLINYHIETDLEKGFNGSTRGKNKFY